MTKLIMYSLQKNLKYFKMKNILEILGNDDYLE